MDQPQTNPPALVHYHGPREPRMLCGTSRSRRRSPMLYQITCAACLQLLADIRRDPEGAAGVLVLAAVFLTAWVLTGVSL